MACAQRSPEHPYLGSFIPSGQMRLTWLPAPVPNPSPWLGFRARRRLRRTRPLLSVVSFCPDRSSRTPSATGKSYSGWAVRPLLQLESSARVAAVQLDGAHRSSSVCPWSRSTYVQINIFRSRWLTSGKI